jgi:NADH-quinone oxidoreductase subunit L
MEHAVWLGLFAPLVGFLILLLTADSISRRGAGVVACTSVLISFLCFAYLLYHYVYGGLVPQTFTLFKWIPVDQINADFAVRLDPLSLLMGLVVTGVGFLIHVYSNGYIEHDEDYARFFACMNFFVFVMLLLVLAANLLLLFVGWEGVGLASYLLIGYWYTRPAAAQAATKAFVVNRVGDWGLLLGLLLTFLLFGTSDFDKIFHQAEQQFSVGAPLMGLLTLLYFIGAIGKSAQIPLHVWLPDAMEGPTPVSALIHAATMVTAGVYLVVRMHPLFLLAPKTLYLVGIIGAVTSLFAALSAIGQMDLKKVLAYSTISQLGLMFLACGIGAFYAAMFHLTTHAFVKALLFLSAGNVVHMMHGTTDMALMGGLRIKFPVTQGLFLIGALALAGIPPLSAFFSKELILEQAHLAGYQLLFYIGLAASILTGFYLIRAYCITFLGQPRLENKVLRAVREAPRVMRIPVEVLALLSIVGGGLGYMYMKEAPLERFLARIGVVLSAKEPLGGIVVEPMTWYAVLGGLAAIGVAAYLYSGPDPLGNPWAVLRKAFYFDQIYDAVFVRPLAALSRFIDNVLEPTFFEGSIRRVTQFAQGAAGWFQQMQSGQIRSYVAWMALGAVLLVAYLVFGVSVHA